MTYKCFGRGVQHIIFRARELAWLCRRPLINRAGFGPLSDLWNVRHASMRGSRWQRCYVDLLGGVSNGVVPANNCHELDAHPLRPMSGSQDGGLPDSLSW